MLAYLKAGQLTDLLACLNLVNGKNFVFLGFVHGYYQTVWYFYRSFNFIIYQNNGKCDAPLLQFHTLGLTAFDIYILKHLYLLKVLCALIGRKKIIAKFEQGPRGNSL